MTVALATCAVAVVATGGADLGVVCLAGAAIGTGAVTAAVAVTDYKSGHARTWTEFMGNLFMGGMVGAMSGAMLYGLWGAIPIAGQTAGLQFSLWTGIVSPLTYTAIPAMVTVGGYGLLGLQGVRHLNEITSIGSGQNYLLDHMFGGNQDAYDTAAMLTDVISMGYVEIALNNPGLAKPKEKTEGTGETYTVDPSMQAKDIEMGVLEDGVYIKNPTAQNISDLVKPGSNYVGNSKMNGQYMYVLDADGNIIIGSRAGQHMPHPTLVGGSNPTVQGAGIVEIRGGKIYSIDNASGHFKPDNSCLPAVQDAFEQLPSNVFHKNFQGYTGYGD